MGRRKISKTLEPLTPPKPKGRPPGAKNKSPANSETTYKRINKELMHHGQRKCKECEEVYSLDKFEVLREIPTNETKDLKNRFVDYTRVYGTTCASCRKHKADIEWKKRKLEILTSELSKTKDLL